nr:xanthine dehydrogenase family protein molybdopterin-binding subunit [Chloroflexia bacterium]
MSVAPEGRPYVGRALPGLGHRRFVVGSGAYVDDLGPSDALHVAFLRSPHAHARILAVEVSAARAARGVVAVFVGDELVQAAPIPVVRFAPDMKVPEYRALSGQAVRYVGEPIAAVVAEARGQADDAVQRIQVEYEPLAAVTTAESALQPDAPILHPELGDNVCYHLVKHGGDVDVAFAQAERVVSVRVAHHRISAVALEPRGLVARFDAAGGELTVWCSSQTPHQLRDDLAAALGLAQHRVRVLVPDIGGDFGSKGSTYREDVAVAALACRLGRAVRWTATRREDLHSTQH